MNDTKSKYDKTRYKNKKNKKMSYYMKTNLLRKIDKDIKKYTIIGFDVETYGNKNKFLLGGVYDKRYHAFTDKNLLHNYLKSVSDPNTLIFATNLGFDYFQTYQDTKYFSETKAIMRNGNLLSASFDGLTFSDTLNFSPSSVESLGKMLNLPKGQKPKCLGKIPKNKNEWTYLKEYNSRDCHISKKFMESFQEVINKLGGQLKLTIASTSLELYKRKYLPFGIWKEFIKKFSDDTTTKDLIFKSYYGGRCECFKRGELNQIYIDTIFEKTIKQRLDSLKVYKMYDFNSLYPSVMRLKFPLPSSAKILESKDGNIKINNIMKYEGISKVSLTCPYMYYPLLPVRYKGKLIFPYGEIRKKTYTHIELRKAIKLGYKINKVYKTIYYTKTFYPFKKYVDTLYKLRLKYKKENNIIYSTVCKLLMNSLYGKFASGENNDIQFIDWKTATMKEINNSVINHKTGKGFKEIIKDNDSNYILPIFASYTTAYGRIKLYDKLVELDAIYCDTDSILTLKFNENSDDIGKLKLEKMSKIGYIIRPKVYEIFDENEQLTYTKIKGIHVKYKDSIQSFDNILNKKPIKQLKFMKFKESVRRQKATNEKIVFNKFIDDEDNKRVWIDKFNQYELQDSKPIELK